MRRLVILNALMAAAGTLASASWAQMNPADMGGLAGMKMVEPAPERPGDRAMTCAQLAREMGEIMKKRNMNAAVASSKDKICRGSAVLKRQGEERQQLMTAQVPELAATNMTGGPAANAVVYKTQAEQMALEARQQPGRKKAVADVHAGIGDMVNVMNDPRIMRLGMLAMEKQCAESMAPPQEEAPAVDNDSCVDSTAIEADNHIANPAAIAPPAGTTDPFVKQGTTAAKPAGSDPFAKR